MEVQYGHVLLFLLMGIAFPIVSLFVSRLVQFRSGDPLQSQPYECGYSPIGSTYVPITIRFYLFALLFLLFDVEALYVLPWALVFKEYGLFALIDMGIFLAILMAGLLYVWMRGALRWGI
jgi:NADH-quinone oxidoreductase subunit A